MEIYKKKNLQLQFLQLHLLAKFSIQIAPERLQMYDVLLKLITRLLEMFGNSRVVELNWA